MGKNIKSFRIFESGDSILDELNDNLSNISDILGTPKISKNRYTESTFVYIFVWDLNFDISVDNDIDKLVEFNSAMKEIIDISATKQRMDNLDFKIRISDKVTLTVYPKVKSDKKSYNFIMGQDWREIKINTTEVTRFFRDNDINVINIEENYEEISEYGSLKIEVDSGTHTNEFVRIFNEEFITKERKRIIDRNIEASGNGRNIEIYPIDEKTYVVKG